jgi:hypothetical protein
MKLGRIQSSLRDEEQSNNLNPALKRRAKLMPTLRVEDTCSEKDLAASSANHVMKGE